LPAHKGEAAEERQVTTLMIQAWTLTGSGALALGTPTGSLALPGGDTVTDALALPFRAFVWHEIV